MELAADELSQLLPSSLLIWHRHFSLLFSGTASLLFVFSLFVFLFLDPININVFTFFNGYLIASVS
jgi:hypothetical protein